MRSSCLFFLNSAVFSIAVWSATFSISICYLAARLNFYVLEINYLHCLSAVCFLYLSLNNSPTHYQVISLLNRPSWPWPWDLRGTLKRKQVAFQRLRIQSKYFRKIQKKKKSESVTAVRGTIEGPLGYEWTYYCLSVCCLIIHNIIIASSFPLLSLCFLACCVCLSWGEYILHFSTIILKCYFSFPDRDCPPEWTTKGQHKRRSH